MKNEFVYRNPIFILEVKKRLAEKRNYKLKTRYMAIDKFPRPKVESQKSSTSLTNSHSQTNFKYFMNFIKEKGYKSEFTKVGNAFEQNKLKQQQKSENINSIKGIPNIIKLYHKVKQNFCDINIKKYDKINQRQTPFQINHIKHNFFKQYIKYIKRKNVHDYIEDEKSIQSYSINSNGKKKKIFGKKQNEPRNSKIIKNYYTPHPASKTTLNRVSSCTNFRNKYFCKFFDLTKKSITLKPNCYYNRLNLSKYSLKTKQK